MLDKNLIKKELYKQKPIAERDFKRDGFTHYSTLVVIDGVEEEVNFKIPDSESFDETKIEGQLLIRWLV